MGSTDVYYIPSGDKEEFVGGRSYSPAHVRENETLSEGNHYVIDHEAKRKGWKKLPVTQVAMLSYGKDGVRLNLYLSTGTIGSYLDHPKQGKTQLFRRKVTLKEAKELLDNPRKHTGTGYHTKEELLKKRKRSGDDDSEEGQEKKKCDSDDDKEELWGRCAACHADKWANEFSKNQRRKGSTARCKECVAANLPLN